RRSRMRRAERAGRQELPLRPRGRGAAGWTEARAQEDPRRRVERHAVLRERARSGRRPCRDLGARHHRRAGHALYRCDGDRRSPDRDRRARQPPRSAVSQRGRSRAGRVVRRARPGEKIVTLDGVTRTLTADMTAICDAQHPTIVAGVMGSAESEVSTGTRDLVLECAYFQPTRIRRTRRALELSSESSYRFERGIDMLGMPDALRRAIELIVAVAGGDLREPPLDLWPEPQQEKTIFLRPERVAHLLGMPVEQGEIERRLAAVA